MSEKDWKELAADCLRALQSDIGREVDVADLERRFRELEAPEPQEPEIDRLRSALRDVLTQCRAHPSADQTRALWWDCFASFDPEEYQALRALCGHPDPEPED